MTLIHYNFPLNKGYDDIDLEKLSYQYVKDNSNFDENNNLIIQPGGWFASAFGYLRGWMFLYNGYSQSYCEDGIYNYKNNKSNKNDESYKFYISVKYEDIPTVWNSILPIIIAGGFQMKAVASEKLYDLLESNTQYGKTLVIYISNPKIFPTEYWTSLFNKIENTLKQLNIEPQNKTECIPLKGSQYISYRQETINGIYVISQNAVESIFFDFVDLKK